MSLKIRRYHANESEFSLNGRNRTSIDVPASVGFTDLTQSKVILDMQVNVTNSNGADELWPVTFGTRGQMVGPQSMIRNAKVTSRTHGLLNERRHQNVIEANLGWYTKSRAEEDAMSLFGNTHNVNYGCDNGGRLPDNPFLQYTLPQQNASTTTSATRRRAEIPVAWKHIDNFGSISQFPNVAVGELTYNLELEDQFNTVAPAVMPVHSYRCENMTAAGGLIGDVAARAITTEVLRGDFNRKPLVGDEVTLWFEGVTTGGIQQASAIISSVTDAVGGGYDLLFTGGIATTDPNEVCNYLYLYIHHSGGFPVSGRDYTPTGTTIGSDTDPITIENVYGSGAGKDWDMHKCPLYVGAPVSVTCYRADNTTVYRSFVSIAKLTAKGDNLELTFDTPLDIVASNPISDIKIAFRDHDSIQALFKANWQVDEIYAELHEIQLTPNQLDKARKALTNLEIPWMDYRLVQKNMPATSTHTEVVQIDPNCLGVAVLTPQNLELLSGFDGCSSYRFALDGKETTNRDVLCGTDPTVGRQVHNHLLKKYWGNLGKSLRKYDANYSNYASPDPLRTHSIFPQVTPSVPYPQVMQLQMFAGNNVMSSKNLFIVSTHQRGLRLSNGRVEVM